MRSHDLARRLLHLPDMELTTTANGQQFTHDVDCYSHGAFKIERIVHYAGGHRLAVGNGLKDETPNWGPLETIWQTPSPYDRITKPHETLLRRRRR